MWKAERKGGFVVVRWYEYEYSGVRKSWTDKGSTAGSGNGVARRTGKRKRSERSNAQERRRQLMRYPEGKNNNHTARESRVETERRETSDDSMEDDGGQVGRATTTNNDNDVG